jgi:hypothetical protein
MKRGHGSKQRETRRNKFAAEMFNTDAPFKHRVERDRKNDYCRHLKHEKKYFQEKMDTY